MIMNTTLIEPYLFFGGCCEAATQFYSAALGAKVEMLMRYRDSPDAMPPGILPPGFEDKVMHASVRIGGARVMMSDGCDSNSNFAGFSLSLALPDKDAAQRAFTALSEGGTVTMPLGKTFWSDCFGMVTDRFGLGWMITILDPNA